jgi:histidinol dehydrogenase
VAGVSRIVCVTPPTKDGSLDPAILEACRIAGVTEIYSIGGAQAVAALAYGTESIEPVSKITGPGNAYVAAAKKICSGDVGIDMIAGPSEVCVVADESADPKLVAIDLMAQAEHDPLASCYLVTFSDEYADEVEAAIDEHMKSSTRAEITTASLADQGLVVVCTDMPTAMGAVNVIAPEHLEMHVRGAMDLLGSIRNAGAIFLGEWTPEAVGDYVAGPNHTLPTGGTARFSSPLSVDDFVKKSSVIQYTAAALKNDASSIMTIADHEGLWAHAQSVRLRMGRIQSAVKIEEEAAGDADE